MSFFYESRIVISDHLAGQKKKWKSTTLNNPFGCCILSIYIIVMLPCPQIVFCPTPGRKRQPSSRVIQWGRCPEPTEESVCSYLQMDGTSQIGQAA